MKGCLSKERVVVKRGRLPKEKAVAGGKASRPTSGPPLINTLSFDKHPLL
jgi:hypothetical protein